MKDRDLAAELLRPADKPRRYHLRDCYVLDQRPGDRQTEAVTLADLDQERYTPCQICGPGGRAANEQRTVWIVKE